MAKRILYRVAMLSALLPLFGASLTGQVAAQNAPTPPKYCNPCLFYAGDFDVNNSTANGLVNERNSTLEAGVFVPFIVPKLQKWDVTGLFVNLLTSTDTVPAKVNWQIRKHVSTGNQGIVIASGSASAKFGGSFNCTPVAVFCFGLVVKGMKLSLPPARYWMAVVPQCTGTSCDGQNYFLADVEDIPPHNHVGPLEPWDDSFFTSKHFGSYFEPTWGSAGACNGTGCDRFSVGVLGTKSVSGQ